MDRNQILNDPETAMRYALQGLQAQMWTAFPAIVQAVNYDQMTVDVAPATKGVATDANGVQSFVNMPVLLDCPLVFPSAGGFTLTLPIIVGDEVLVVISSRCIDAWWQSGGNQNPIELRMHDLSDGFALPGPKSLPNVVPTISTTNAQLRNNAGTVYLEITPDGGINMVAPSGVTITGETTITGVVNITGDTNITGALSVTGEITATGDIVAEDPALGTSRSLNTHIHYGGTVPPAGVTGEPYP